MLGLGEVQKVLQNLLDEGISIRDLLTIFETLADHAATTRDTDVLTEYVRQSLKRAISSKYFPANETTSVITVDPKIEQEIMGSVKQTEQGAYLTLDPERTKAIIPVDLGGIPCDYDRLMAIVERKKGLFVPKTDLQRMIGRVAICSDCAHSFGGYRMKDGKKVMCGVMADFSSFSFHAVKNFTTAEGGALTWNLPFGEELVQVELDRNPEYTFSALTEKDRFNHRLSQI